MMKTNPLKLGRKDPPTRAHRPAVWECMLGTVYANSPNGEVRYFDYKWDEAVAWALGEGRTLRDVDPRTYRASEPLRFSKAGTGISRRQYVLWFR